MKSYIGEVGPTPKSYIGMGTQIANISRNLISDHLYRTLTYPGVILDILHRHSYNANHPLSKSHLDSAITQKGKGILNESR